jgi:hypothetical protein
VVIALDGRVEAVVPAIARTTTSYRFSTFVPEQRLDSGSHEIAIYAVVDPTASSRLDFVHRERIELPAPIDPSADGPRP